LLFACTAKAQFATLLSNLSSKDDGLELQSLIELCEILAVSTEDTLQSTFQTEPFVTALVEVLHNSMSPDAMLLCCRAMTYILEGE
jgi:E3 ubiquitin-protein ligase TRIP12